MDGIEAARQIKAVQQPLLIFITGYSDEKVKRRACALQPDGYTVTPEHIVPLIVQPWLDRR
jgi:CheY-like chemotaxis protein